MIRNIYFTINRNYIKFFNNHHDFLSNWILAEHFVSKTPYVQNVCKNFYWEEKVFVAEALNALYNKSDAHFSTEIVSVRSVALLIRIMCILFMLYTWSQLVYHTMKSH